MDNVINNWHIIAKSGKQLVRRLGTLLAFTAISVMALMFMTGIGSILAVIFDKKVGAEISEKFQTSGFVPAFQGFANSFEHTNNAVQVVVACLLIVLFMFIRAFFAVVIKSISSNEPAITISNIALAMNRLIPLSVAIMLFILCGQIGLVALVIPGLYIISSWCLYAPIIVYENVGPVEAFRRSYRMMCGYRLKFLGLVLILTLITFVFGLTMLVFNPMIVALILCIVPWLMCFLYPLCIFHYYYALRDKAE